MFIKNACNVFSFLSSKNEEITATSLFLCLFSVGVILYENPCQKWGGGFGIKNMKNGDSHIRGGGKGGEVAYRKRGSNLQHTMTREI